MSQSKHLAPAPGPYDACVQLQEASNDVVIYSITAGQPVVVAWDMPVSPSDIKEWLHSRGLHWPCFCNLTNDSSCTSKSSRIVQELNGDLHVVCHENPSVCMFFIDLSQTYRTTDLFSEYLNLPTTVSGVSPSMGSLLASFLGDRAIASSPYSFFEGYCGEHLVDYPDITQLWVDHGTGHKGDTKPTPSRSRIVGKRPVVSMDMSAFRPVEVVIKSLPNMKGGHIPDPVLGARVRERRIRASEEFSRLVAAQLSATRLATPPRGRTFVVKSIQAAKKLGDDFMSP